MNPIPATFIVNINGTPTPVDSSPFSNTPELNQENCILYVPEGSKAAYEAANYWKKFKRIVEIGSIDATGITLSQSTLSFNAANQTATLAATVTPSNATNKNVTWTSSNTSVATVSSTGVVTAKANGTATITARTNDGTNLTATCTVTVAIPIINFADANVKAICVANWDTNGDGELSKAEAAAVTALGEVFKNNSLITSFDELQYFTGLTEINDFAFYNTRSLTSIIIPQNVTRIGEDAFNNTSSVYSSYPSALTNVQLPNGLTVIDEDAFFGCLELSNIIFPSSLRSIGDAAFDQTGLTSLILPDGLETIAYSAFANCSSLAAVYIPSTVTIIGDAAFAQCGALHSLAVENPTPVTISSAVFSNRANATLIVPVGSKAAYEAANYWKEFKRIIEFIEGDVNGDGEMDVVDVVDIARYVVGTPAETFVPILADITSDGNVNIGDAVALVNEIAGDQNFVKAQRAPQRVSESEETLMLKGADNNLSLVLQNTHKYTAFQFDLYVPDGVDVASMLLNVQRKQKHQLLYNKVEDGHWRVTAFSTSNRSFDGNDGELLAIVLDGIASDDISICNIHFFTADGGDYEFDDLIMQSGIVTDIDSPSMSPATVCDGSIYTLDGRRVSGKPQQKGIYIVNGKKIVKR